METYINSQFKYIYLNYIYHINTNYLLMKFTIYSNILVFKCVNMQYYSIR